MTIPMSPSELVIDEIQITSLPEVYNRVNEMTENAHYSVSDIGHIIANDPGLSTRILRVVNSSFYGFPSKIDTISRAITILGTRELRDIIITTSVTKVFSGLPDDLINMETFWRHSVYCAVVSRILAVQLKKDFTERYFLSGLIHDIGSLLIYLKIPELAREAILMCKNQNIELHQAERIVMGFDHAEAGAELLRSWKLPDSIIETIEFHHMPERSHASNKAALIIHLADTITNHTQAGKNFNTLTQPINPYLWDMIGLSDSSLDEIVSEADEQFESALQLVHMA